MDLVRHAATVSTVLDGTAANQEIGRKPAEPAAFLDFLDFLDEKQAECVADAGAYRGEPR